MCVLRVVQVVFNYFRHRVILVGKLASKPGGQGSNSSHAESRTLAYYQPLNYFNWPFFVMRHHESIPWCKNLSDISLNAINRNDRESSSDSMYCNVTHA
jgi:hypothetical protein